MYRIWKKKSQEDIKHTVFSALKENVNYGEQHMLGLPASYLDDKVFNQDASFLSESPYLSTLIQNPNHIGCHTLGHSESYFAGTQQIEIELIEICAVDILKGNEGEHDGYVASGGTEANIQAIWIYRNYYQQEFNAKRDEICILCSEDSHYSMAKGANLLAIDIINIGVMGETREIDIDTINEAIGRAKSNGKKYFIVVANMMTTMFGSVDDVDLLTDQLSKNNCEYKLHIDGAYGGFFYPFANEESRLTFTNPNITSVTLDAHKMAQAPYGTGIFLIKKGFIEYANTKEATYVEGTDLTLIGSRSGANAIASWMILVKNGPYGWQEKIYILLKRTEWMCNELRSANIKYYRNPHSNIIAIRSNYVSKDIAGLFGLVPDNHDHPRWYKIVVMDHVTIEKLQMLLSKLA